MTAITQIYETVLYASDLAAVSDFYSRVLGLTMLPGMGDRGVVFQATDQSVLLLFDPARTSAPNQAVPGHGARGEGHVAFTVPTLDPWRIRFAQAGIAIEREVDWPLGGRSLYVRDPARNSVELVMGRVWDLTSANADRSASDAPPAVGRPVESPPNRAGDPLDLLLGHNAWATREILRVCRRLDARQWQHPFPMGLGSLRDTLTHVVAAMRYWSDRIAGPPRPVRPFLDNLTPRSVDEVAALLEEAVADLSRVADRARARGLDTEIDLVLGGTPQRYTLGAMLVHVTTHGMHHRAQCLNMLRHLEVPGLSDQLPDIDVLEWQLVQRRVTPTGQSDSRAG